MNVERAAVGDRIGCVPVGCFRILADRFVILGIGRRRARSRFRIRSRNDVKRSGVVDGIGCVAVAVIMRVLIDRIFGICRRGRSRQPGRLGVRMDVERAVVLDEVRRITIAIGISGLAKILVGRSISVGAGSDCSSCFRGRNCADVDRSAGGVRDGVRRIAVAISVSGLRDRIFIVGSR